MLGRTKKRIGLSVLVLAASGLAMTAPVYASTSPYYPLYYTASYNGSLYRQHSPFQLSQPGISETNVTNSNGTTVTLNAGSSTSTGFVVEGGPLGSLRTKKSGGPALAMIQVKGTGSFQVNLWIDANSANDNTTNGDWFSWNAALSATPSPMTSQGGDIILQAPASNGQVIINGSTSFLDKSNGETYTLNQIQSGKVTGFSSNDNVAVWVGVNSGSATITDLKVNSTPVPLGQLPEVPYAAALPLAGGIVLVGGIIWHRRRNRA